MATRKDWTSPTAYVSRPRLAIARVRAVLSALFTSQATYSAKIQMIALAQARLVQADHERQMMRAR